MRRKPPAASAVEVSVTVSGAPAAARVKAWGKALLAGRWKGGPRRGAGVSILLCGDARMRGLNRSWRGKDRPTDVLSFPSGEDAFLGDVVIDVPYAARQARRLGHGLDREIQILLTHGLLHVLGHDHETDDGDMFRLQSRRVAAVFGPGPDGVPEDETRPERP